MQPNMFQNDVLKTSLEYFVAPVELFGQTEKPDADIERSLKNLPLNFVSFTFVRVSYTHLCVYEVRQ